MGEASSFLEAILDTHRITQNIGGGTGPIKQLPSGSVLADRYLIQDVIGVGGMGSVYRARDLHFPNVVKLVAVKEMINQNRDPMTRQTVIQNFEREANILVTLNHSAIPKIFDYFSHDERSYLVLEYIHGKDLEAILSETNAPLEEDQVVSWAIEICDVLDYLHNHKPEPIIFRDMKPSNIMVNQSGRIMLIDFGIAKVFRSGQKGTMIGTEGYSPPEQYRGEASPQADIYALGATMHHLLTNRDPRVEPPFSFAERPVRQINPAVSQDVETIIDTALQYNPSDRYRSAKQMKDALIAVAKKAGMFSRFSVAVAAPEQTVKPLWVFKCEDEVRGSPTYDVGSIFIGSYDHNLYALDAANGEFLWKAPTDGGVVTKPVVTPDLTFVGSEDGFLHAFHTRTGRPAWTFDVGSPIRSSPKIAEGHIIFGADNGFLYCVNILSTRQTFRYDSAEAIRSSPYVTNENIYFGNEAGDFICLDFRGQSKWHFRAKRAVTSSPLISQGIVFFTSVDSSVYALDAKSGWVVWRFRMMKGSISSPAIMGNFIYFGSADGNIYCLEADNAKEIWKFQTGSQVSGSPAIYRDWVYCGTADGTMYCLDHRTGRVRWKFLTDGPITGMPAIFNDMVYFGSADHMVYALSA